MRKPKCPVCRREVAKAFIRRTTFPCPNCDAPLRIPQLNRSVLAAALVVFGFSAAILIPYTLGLRENALIAAAIVLLAPCGIGLGLVLGAVLGYFFPRLEKDPGWQDGEILHIVPPPGPSKGRP